MSTSAAEARISATLAKLYRRFASESKRYLGYPNNLLLHNRSMARFLDFAINNIGDPFVGNNGIHTCEFERRVLEYYADLLGIGREDFWGYVTTGGTEGNLFGLLAARNFVPHGIVYYSNDSHYSIRKGIFLLKLEGVVVKSQKNGEMDYGDLEERLALHKGRAPIVVANIGTTMKGAVDDVARIRRAIDGCGARKSYVHCDGALMGAILPYVADRHVADFTLPISSISISGHKFLGSPIPCGVVLARKAIVEHINGRVEYIGSFDNTISGSRNGITALMMWKTIEEQGEEGFRAWARECMEMKAYALGELARIGWPAWSNELSNTVVIRRPSEFLARKWHLAVLEDIAHIITMPGVSRELIDSFVADLAESRKNTSE
jgi:histidine decarboxylase